MRALITSRVLLTLALAGTMLAPAHADDSGPSIDIGGLISESHADIRADAEDLYLSLEKVRVRYSYTNTGKKPVTLLVAFPLPDVPVPGTDLSWIEAAYPDWPSYLEMKTLVNGKRVDLMRIDIARVDGVDVDKQLRELGWPTRFWEHPDIYATVNALSADDKSDYVNQGLLTIDPLDPDFIKPAWTVSTSYVRTQTFAPGKTTIEHSYRPMQSGRADSALDREGRNAPPEAEVPDYRMRYCVDEPFTRAYDKQRYLPDGTIDDRVSPFENWIGYLLSQGAGKRGPVGTFKLTVDKGFPDRLVSLCAEGMKKVSPTRFEMTRTNYEPTQDLHVLFIGFSPSEGGV